MPALGKMSLAELEDLAAKLRHALARNPEHSRMQQVALDDVKQWIAIRQNRDELESEPSFRLLQFQLIGRISGIASAFSNSTDMRPSLRTLFTKAGRKHAMQVPSTCRTLA
jgi:hypothetical protein